MKNIQQGKNCGIYCIENLITNKKYIGQSKNIARRWEAHRSALNNGAHVNRHLQSAWNKYGELNFSFYILEYCAEEYLNQKEQYWIAYYNTKDGGYNLTCGGDGRVGMICSETTKEKISKANKGKVRTDEQKRRIRESLINSPNVLRGAKHPYFGKKLSAEQIECLCRGRIEYYKSNNYTPSWARAVICVTTGEIFSSITKGTQKYPNASQSNITACCNHKRGFAGELSDGTRLQWEWYIKDKKYMTKPQITRSNKERAVLQYDLQNNFIQEWKSAKECSDFTGLQRSRICDVCKGNRRKTGGYIFKYKSDVLDRSGKEIPSKTELKILN